MWNPSINPNIPKFCPPELEGSQMETAGSEEALATTEQKEGGEYHALPDPTVYGWWRRSRR